jgi:hypothetical protein
MISAAARSGVDQGLQDRPRHRESGADQRAEQHPGDPDQPHDRILGCAPVGGRGHTHGVVADDARHCEWRDRYRAEPGGDQEYQHQCDTEAAQPPQHPGAVARMAEVVDGVFVRQGGRHPPTSCARAPFRPEGFPADAEYHPDHGRREREVAEQIVGQERNQHVEADISEQMIAQ